MKKCKSCGKDHEGTFGSGKYCNRSCANKRTHSKETIEKIRKSQAVERPERQKRTTKTCPMCKETFWHLSSGIKIYCSKKCYNDDSTCKYRKPAPGGYRKGSGRGKSGWYSSPIAGEVFLDSSWERKYAEYLDENKINWKRNTTRFPYIINNKESYYIPDFYIVDEDTYIEIKGFKTKLDETKWTSLDNLKVLYGKDLKALDLDV